MRLDLAVTEKIDLLEDRNEKVYRAALYYISLDIVILPIPYGERFVSDKQIYTKFSKQRSKIEEWFNPQTGSFRGQNIAIGCGDYFGKGGVFAIDIDVKYHKKYGSEDFGASAFDKLVKENGKVYGPVQRTPSGGRHILTKWQPNCTPSQNKIALGVDTRGGHEGKISSHIMAFPSVADDVQYQWEEGGDIIDVPPWIMQAMGVAWDAKKAANGSARGNESMGADDVEQIEPFERIEKALYSIDPCELDYDEWVRCGQAIHSQYDTAEGAALWDTWSQQDPRYKENDCFGRWKGFRAGGTVRVATLFYMAKKYGKIPEQKAPNTPDDEIPIVQDIVDDYNAQYGLVLSGEKTKVVRKEVDIETGQPIYSTYAVDSFKQFRSNDVVMVNDDKGNPKPIKKFDIWMASPKRRTFDGMLMRPDMPAVINLGGHQYLNTWAGFTIDPAPGDWSLMKTHIYKYLCSGNDENFEWLMDWMADMFQEPDKPKGCAVILGGKEGTGKGTLANAIAYIFGIHGTIVSNSSHLNSQYNSMLMDSVFIFADEVIYGGNHDAANKLKAMVTEEKNIREKKFGDQKQVRTFMHIMMASNNHWKIAAGPQSRRWFVLEVDDGMASNPVYFAAISNQMKSGGYEAMLDELLNREITCNLRLAPVTRELRHQRALMSVQSTFESFPAWVAHVVTTGHLGCRDSRSDTVDEKDAWPGIITKSDLWESYAKWSKEYKPRATVLAISIFFTRLNDLGFINGDKTEILNGRAKTCYVPSFAEFAEKSQENYAIDIDLDEDTEDDEPEM